MLSLLLCIQKDFVEGSQHGKCKGAHVHLRQEIRILRTIRDFIEPFRGRTDTNFNRKVVQTHVTHTAAYAVGMHSKYSVMATTGADHTTRIVDTRSWKCTHTLPFGLRSVAFHPSRPIMAVGGDTHAEVYDFSSGQFRKLKSIMLTKDGYCGHFVAFVPSLKSGDVLCVYTRWSVDMRNIRNWERIPFEARSVGEGPVRIGGPYLGYKRLIDFHADRPYMIRRWRNTATLSLLQLVPSDTMESLRITDMHTFKVEGLEFPRRGFVLGVAFGPNHLGVSVVEPAIELRTERARIVHRQRVQVVQLNTMFDCNSNGFSRVNVVPRRRIVPSSRVSGVLDPGVYFQKHRPHVVVSCHRYLDVFHANTGAFLHSIRCHTACINDVMIHPVLDIMVTVASDKRAKVCVHNTSPDAQPPKPQKRGRWDRDEINLLNYAVAKIQRQNNGQKDWSEISNLIPGRNAKQCSSAYRHRNPTF